MKIHILINQKKYGVCILKISLRKLNLITDLLQIKKKKTVQNSH